MDFSTIHNQSKERNDYSWTNPPKPRINTEKSFHFERWKMLQTNEIALISTPQKNLLMIYWMLQTKHGTYLQNILIKKKLTHHLTYDTNLVFIITVVTSSWNSITSLTFWGSKHAHDLRHMQPIHDIYQRLAQYGT